MPQKVGANAGIYRTGGISSTKRIDFWDAEKGLFSRRLHLLLHDFYFFEVHQPLSLVVLVFDFL